jgi:hypothetical protein
MFKELSTAIDRRWKLWLHGSECAAVSRKPSFPILSMIQADNPIVWKVLKPILQLTTRYLDNSHLWPWYVQYCVGFEVTDELIAFPRWDALLTEADCNNKSTEPSPHFDGMHNLFFKRRTAEEIYNKSLPLKDLLREMAGKWFLCLRSSYRDPAHGGPQDDNWWGVTIPTAGPGKGSVTLCTQFITSLLRSDLTV